MTGLALLLVGSLAASLAASSAAAQPPVSRAAPASLDTTRVKAARAADSAAGAGRTTVTLSTREARLAGASSVNALLALLPYATLRSARGETGLSLRGARREQVAITLDGMPLNDPATGIADVSDLPLAGVQSATVALGADPVAPLPVPPAACWHSPPPRSACCRCVRRPSGSSSWKARGTRPPAEPCGTPVRRCGAPPTISLL
ncbi:MAG: Plug domain-containing protein [Gemmatimonadota bacterium]|nr:Plug domain-containing protein [Gemmatimonadota bacterium]